MGWGCGEGSVMAETFLRPQERGGDGRFWLRGLVDSGGSWMWHSGGQWSPSAAVLHGGQGAQWGSVLDRRAGNILQHAAEAKGLQRVVCLQRRGRWPNLRWIKYSIWCVIGLPLQKVTTGQEKCRLGSTGTVCSTLSALPTQPLDPLTLWDV